METGVLYRFKADDGITKQGMEKIASLLWREFGFGLPRWFSNLYIDTQVFPGHETSTVINGERVMVPTELSGKFAKRVKKFLNLARNINPDNNFMQELGKLAAENAMYGNELWYDFTDDFGWTDGDFGDKGSCLFARGEKSRVLRWMEHNGMMAIRAFHSENPNCGMARAWMYPLPNRDAYVIFNGYFDPVKARMFLRDGRGLLLFAQILSAHVNKPYSECDYPRDKSGQLWLNGDAYSVGDTGGRVEFDFERYATCYLCNSFSLHPSDDGFITESYSGYYKNFCPMCIKRVMDNDIFFIRDKIRSCTNKGYAHTAAMWRDILRYLEEHVEAKVTQ